MYVLNLRICAACEHYKYSGNWPSCGIDGRRTAAHAAEGTCPIGKYTDEARAQVADTGIVLPKIPIDAHSSLPAVDTRFHQLWHALHRRPIEAGETFDLFGDSAWLSDFEREVSCGPCREHWQEINQRTPPDFSSRAAYAKWTWAAHNEVNRKLNKPQFSYDEAAKLYGWNF